ncbi:HAD hydrolase-like protein [Bombilactobacillus apium]|uniref:HAD hydrolase-like protein n=1 Tax=Bombilactobacillus apium TaxID=2675299 RepID=UPI003898D8F7
MEHGSPRTPLFERRFALTGQKLGFTWDGPQLEKQYRQLLDHNFRILPGADRLLKNLRKNHKTLIAASNGVQTTQIQRLVGSGLRQYFDQVFISENSGFAKPGPRFFTPLYQSYPHLSSKNAILIGDRLPFDILGACRVSLSSVW